MKGDPCTAPDCTKPIQARDLCPMHYQRQRIHGSMHRTRHKETRPEMEARFWSRVKQDPGCWLWQGRIGQAGYGVFDFQGGEQRAHRLAYEMRVGEIPSGMVIDHVCHTPNCVRPDHLRLATVKQNAENRRGGNSNGRSGIRGVFYIQRDGKWRGCVGHYGVRYVKNFSDPNEAAKWVRAKRLELYTHTVEKRSA